MCPLRLLYSALTHVQILHFINCIAQGYMQRDDRAWLPRFATFVSLSQYLLTFHRNLCDLTLRSADFHSDGLHRPQYYVFYPMYWIVANDSVWSKAALGRGYEVCSQKLEHCFCKVTSDKHQHYKILLLLWRAICVWEGPISLQKQGELVNVWRYRLTSFANALCCILGRTRESLGSLSHSTFCGIIDYARHSRK